MMMMMMSVGAELISAGDRLATPHFRTVTYGAVKVTVLLTVGLSRVIAYSGATRFSLARLLIVISSHVMQTRYSDENSVCPSVTRVHCDKTEERSVHILHHTKYNLA